MDADPDPIGNLVLKLAVLFLLILVNAFFAMSEIAVISLSENKLRRMAEDGNKKAKKVLNLSENSSSFLSTIQIGVTLAGFLTSASAAENFSEPLAKLVAGVAGLQPAAWLKTLSTVVVTLIISYFSLVLGELVPKRIAMHQSEKVSFAVVDILLFFKRLFTPFIKLLSVSTNSVLRVIGINPNASEDNVTEEDILMLVDAGEEKGVIEESQKEMINNIFEFDDITASDVMTHRTDVSAVDITDDIDDVLKISIEEGYSRIPVYEDELDNIKGIVYVKDLLPFVGRQVKDKTLSALMREAYFVPESKRCGDLFKEMTEKRLQMVIVSDEYGGVAGLVTIEDLLESIVGNIRDEYDNEEDEVERVDDKTVTVDGTTDISEIEELLDITIPEGEYDTIGGFIMSELGRIPQDGENPTVESCGCVFTVEGVDERRIERVRIEKLPDAETDDSENE